MDLIYFPHFIRTNFPSVIFKNSNDIKEIGEEFKKYLEEKFQDKLVDIWDINPQTVIMNSEHPFFVNGYSPVLILHFTQFIDEMQKQIEEEIEKD